MILKIICYVYNYFVVVVYVKILKKIDGKFYYLSMYYIYNVILVIYQGKVKAI